MTKQLVFRRTRAYLMGGRFSNMKKAMFFTPFIMCLSLVAQVPKPTGFLTPINWVATNPNGTYSSLMLDSNGNLYTSGSPALGPTPSGFIQPMSPVAYDSLGIPHFLLVDGSGNLLVTSTGGGNAYYTGTQNDVACGTGTAHTLADCSPAITCSGTICSIAAGSSIGSSDT